jgi:PmbA protein
MSIGIVDQLFENGAPVQGVSEVNMADNHLNLWSRLVEAGNDPYPYSSAKIPSLVFRDVVCPESEFLAAG